MPSELGKLIRSTRTAVGFGLREFAREIGKSPAFLTQLECDDESPSVAEETLRTIAEKLDLDPDELIVRARRTPSDVVPESSLEVALFRKVKGMSAKKQQEVLKRWSTGDDKR
jgi:transcriptional regulator with XRE-family HTH domain